MENVDLRIYSTICFMLAACTSEHTQTTSSTSLPLEGIAAHFAIIDAGEEDLLARAYFVIAERDEVMSPEDRVALNGTDIVEVKVDETWLPLLRNSDPAIGNLRYEARIPRMPAGSSYEMRFLRESVTLASRVLMPDRFAIIAPSPHSELKVDEYSEIDFQPSAGANADGGVLAECAWANLNVVGPKAGDPGIIMLVMNERKSSSVKLPCEATLWVNQCSEESLPGFGVQSSISACQRVEVPVIVTRG